MIFCIVDIGGSGIRIKSYNKTSKNIVQNLEEENLSIEFHKYIDSFDNKNIFLMGDAFFSFPPSFAQGASQSIESANDLFNDLNNNLSNYYKKRVLKKILP